MNEFNDPNFWGWPASTDEDPQQLLRDIHLMIASSPSRLICSESDDPSRLLLLGMVVKNTNYYAPRGGRTCALHLIVTDLPRLQPEFFDLWKELQEKHRVWGGPQAGAKQNFILWREKPQWQNGDGPTAEGGEAKKTTVKGKEKPAPLFKKGLSRQARAALIESLNRYEDIGKEQINPNQFVDLLTLGDVTTIYAGATRNAGELWKAELERPNIKDKIIRRSRLSGSEIQPPFSLDDVRLKYLISGSLLRRERDAAVRKHKKN